MPLSNAQKQARYRAKHLGIDGGKVRLQAMVSVHTEARLKRLAHHQGFSQTTALDRIIADAHGRVVEPMSPEEQGAFYRDTKPPKHELRHEVKNAHPIKRTKPAS